VKTSIVITAYNRSKLLRSSLESFRRQRFKEYEVIVVDDSDNAEDQKATENVCAEFNVEKYIFMNRPATFEFRNPALPLNVGIKAAVGEVLIIQNAECKHVSDEVIYNLSCQVNYFTAVFASVSSREPNGDFKEWYTHSVHKRYPYFFCGAVSAKLMNLIRGFDEDYKFLGYDDNDMADRLRSELVEMKFDDGIEVHHQWHPPSFHHDRKTNMALYAQKKAAMEMGKLTTIRNLGRDWGVLSA
jgi:glycosyltransferase involved in cell wall biosynthesis